MPRPWPGGSSFSDTLLSPAVVLFGYILLLLLLVLIARTVLMRGIDALCCGLAQKCEVLRCCLILNLWRGHIVSSSHQERDLVNLN